MFTIGGFTVSVELAAIVLFGVILVFLEMRELE